MKSESCPPPFLTVIPAIFFTAIPAAFFTVIPAKAGIQRDCSRER